MQKLNQLFFILLAFLVAGCSNDANLKKRAYELAHTYIITDGHIDVPWRLNDGYEDFDVPFMSIYVPSSYQETGGAKEKADSLIDLVHRIANDHPDKFEVAYSPNDGDRIFSQGKIALPMGMENGAPIEDNLNNVAYFHKRGIRYITLTHAKDNLICDSSYDTTNTWDGLSPFGRQVVAEMNRVGIMVDISHVTDAVINQVLDMAKAPVIASHSSCRKFTPGWQRNMGDPEIKRLKENGGVIQINYGSSFVTQASQDKRQANTDKIAAYAKKNGLEQGDEQLKVYAKKVSEDNPIYADITEVIDHIDHVVKLAGIDHVGIGSDYDGVGDSLPYGLKDVSSYPNLIYHLLKRGYSDEDIAKICYKNIWRVWKEVESVAANLQES